MDFHFKSFLLIKFILLFVSCTPFQSFYTYDLDLNDHPVFESILKKYNLPAKEIFLNPELLTKEIDESEGSVQVVLSMIQFQLYYLQSKRLFLDEEKKILFMEEIIGATELKTAFYYEIQKEGKETYFNLYLDEDRLRYDRSLKFVKKRKYLTLIVEGREFIYRKIN